MVARQTVGALGLSALVLAGGCAAGISERALSQVTYRGSFSALQGQPATRVGEVVLLGGKILETRASAASSEIAVLELPLSSGDRPKGLDQSEGRFLIRSPRFLDPAVYRAGALLTMVGRVIGSEVRPIGGYDYAYPLVEPIEIKLWPQDDRGPARLHFGVGIGTAF